MWVSVILFIIGLVLLVKGGDWFVDGASGIAKKMKMSEIVIGATVVSIGTTLPEVMVSATAAFSGNGGIAYGNAIGSIICNTALIAAITITFMPGKVDRKSLILAVAFFFVTAAAYALVAVFYQKFTRIFGVILLSVFVVYIVTLLIRSKKDPQIVAPEEEEDKPQKQHGLLFLIAILVVGAALIALGAHLLVKHGTIIAEGLGVSQAVIALTIVALGTSLPELVTAITSIVKGHSSLSVGNVIGANFFNLVLVSGMAMTVKPFDLPAGRTIAEINSSLLIDLPVMFAVMLLMTLPPMITGKLKRWQGITLLCVYAAFITFQFVF